VAGPHPPATARPATLARELDLLLADVAGSVDDVIVRAHPTPESLHELHRQMRRLRHGLALWEELLATHHRELVQPLDRRLKRIARLVGRVRDRDVMLELIEGPTLPRPDPDDPQFARLRARLRDDARTGRELLRVILRSERDAQLFDSLRGSLEFPPLRASTGRLQQLLEEEEARRQKETRAAQRRARRRPTSARMHRLRIRARRLRHLAEFRARLEPSYPSRVATPVRRLQSQLGRLHDLDIVLDGIDATTRASPWGRALRRERRKARDRIRSSLTRFRWPKRRLVVRRKLPPASAGAPRRPGARS
jgi:CHAD domain-containing protein